jgi:DNA transformation protein and related proteins
MTSIRSMRNIGPRSAAWLNTVGINTIDDLVETGVIEAFLRARAAFPRQVTLNLLYALEGAMLNIPWNKLSEEIKANLQEQVSQRSTSNTQRGNNETNYG